MNSSAPNAGPVRTACPGCGHPLMVELWSRADTVSEQMVEEVVITDPIGRKPVERCPGCGTALDKLAQRYRSA